MAKLIYFLGYSKNKTRLINYLKKKKNIKLVQLHNRDLSLKNAFAADLIISFGYKKIIKKNILQMVKRPIINLHISFLPYNRGSHPNYWSFVENTPKGITIHEVDEEIDRGKIIIRKKVNFENIKRLTFKNTYDILINEIERQFIINFNKILKNNYITFRAKEIGSFHKKNDLPKFFKTWDIDIYKYLKNYKN